MAADIGRIQALARVLAMQAGHDDPDALTLTHGHIPLMKFDAVDDDGQYVYRWRFYTSMAEQILTAMALVPVPMLIWCPACGVQHVDAPEPATGWTNPPHRSHTCHGCGVIFRVADYCTTGVASIVTRGSADTYNPGAAVVDTLREPAAYPKE